MKDIWDFYTVNNHYIESTEQVPNKILIISMILKKLARPITHMDDWAYIENKLQGTLRNLIVTPKFTWHAPKGVVITCLPLL